MANFLRQVLTNLHKLNKKSVSTHIPCVGNRFYANAPTPYEIVDTQEDQKIQQEIVNKVKQQILQKQEGRKFAVIHIVGKQIKITEGDVFVVEGYWPPDAGDKIRLDKVLVVGTADFTLIGRPLVQRNLVNIEATIIEKTLSHTKTHFRKIRRKQYMRINFYRIPQTMVRVNSIEFTNGINL